MSLFPYFYADKLDVLVAVVLVAIVVPSVLCGPRLLTPTPTGPLSSKYPSRFYYGYWLDIKSELSRVYRCVYSISLLSYPPKGDYFLDTYLLYDYLPNIDKGDYEGIFWF